MHKMHSAPATGGSTIFQKQRKNVLLNVSALYIYIILNALPSPVIEGPLLAFIFNEFTLYSKLIYNTFENNVIIVLEHMVVDSWLENTSFLHWPWAVVELPGPAGLPRVSGKFQHTTHATGRWWDYGGLVLGWLGAMLFMGSRRAV